MFKLVCVVIVFIFISGCSQGNDGGSVLSSSKIESDFATDALPTPIAQPEGHEKSKYLAYIHNLVIELKAGKLALAHKAVVDACDADSKFKCTILEDDYRAGQYSSGRIQLRVTPAGVGYFLSLASQDGAVASQSRVSEDLAASILDNAKRIEHLERFEKKLIALEGRTDADIDSLLKVASQLSETQTQLEYLQGSKAALLQRVQMEIVNISFVSENEASFIKSMGAAFSGFGDEFTYAIEGLIGSAAHIIPWTVFLLLLFFILRAIFRFFNIKIFNGRRSAKQSDANS